MIGRSTTKCWSGSGINCLHQYVHGWGNADGWEKIVYLLWQEPFVEFAFGFGGFEMLAGNLVSFGSRVLRCLRCQGNSWGKERQQRVTEVQVNGKQHKISPQQ